GAPRNLHSFPTRRSSDLIAFAKVLLEAARSNGFKGLVATTGASALTMAREYHPSVITLDIFLPDMQGWRILDRLKADLGTCHVRSEEHTSELQSPDHLVC